MNDDPALAWEIVVGLEFDQLTASCEWRWYLEDRSSEPITYRTGEWRKKRNRAKKDLQAELVEKKETKKDPDRVRLEGKSWVWGPDRYFPRNDPEAQRMIEQNKVNKQRDSGNK